VVALRVLRLVGIGPSQQPTAAHRLRVGELMDQLGLAEIWPNALPPALRRQSATAAAARALVHDSKGAGARMSPLWHLDTPGPLPAAADPARPGPSPAQSCCAWWTHQSMQSSRKSVAACVVAARGRAGGWPVSERCRTAPQPPLLRPRPCRCAQPAVSPGAAGGGSSLNYSVK